MVSKRKYRFLAAIAISIIGVFIVLASYISALVTIKHLSLVNALIKALKSFISSPVGSLASILPFGFLGFFISSKRKRDYIYIVPLVLIIPYYFYRYQLAEIYLTKKLWTASALSLGMAPIHSAILIFLCFGIKHIILEIIDMRKDKKK